MDFKVESKFDENKTKNQLLNDNRLLLFKLMNEINTEAKKNCPVDTGRLRASIHLSPVKPANKIVLSDGVYYGCVFGAHTSVKCSDGLKTIGQVKIGDLVYAQDGLLHKVINTSRFLVEEKPGLVELEVEYRKNRVHKLVLTQDHKVLSSINGCGKWIKAGDLKNGNVVFSPIKKGKNKGLFLVERISNNCLNCGKQFRTRLSEKKKYNKGVFCCSKCKKEFYKGENNPNFGNKYSKKTRDLLSKKKKLFLKLNPDKHVNRILAKKGFMTNIEKQVFDWLNNSGIEFEKQKRIGNKFVDFYVPNLKLIIECDGAFWHKNQNKDVERDKYLLNKIKDFVIIHLHFVDYKWSKNIVKNPLENVYYIKCNPSLNSFVNPDFFKEVKVLNVKKFEYKKNNKRNKALLYDLSVEGMHSFVANGVLISNSFQEFGTSRMRGKPFFRPALNKVVRKGVERFL
jgi:very-short-patch-repair endonuclease/ribosomal protein L37AE/L43A